MYDYRMHDPKPYSMTDSIMNQHGSGDTRYQRYDRFQFRCAPITAAPNYVINRDGAVFDIESGDRIQPEDSNHIMLNGKRYTIDILLLYGFIGELPLPIVDRDRVPITKMYIGRRCSKLTYFIKSMKRDLNDPDVIYLDKVPFKRIPFAKGDLFISKNGVVYDAQQDDFVMRSFAFGYAQCVIIPDEQKYREFFPDRAEDPDTPKATWWVQHLVYCAYLGTIPKGMQVDHKDNVRYHNTPDNLQLLTPVENTRKSRESGRRNTGFTYEMNETIAKMLSEGQTNEAIAKALGFKYKDRHDKHRIASIVNKLRTQPGYYDDLKVKYNLGNYDPNNSYPYKRLTPKIREQIRLDSAAGMKGYKLAEKYGVSTATISHIINDN